MPGSGQPPAPLSPAQALSRESRPGAAESPPREEPAFQPVGAVAVTLLYLGLIAVMWGYMYWTLLLRR